MRRRSIQSSHVLVRRAKFLDPLTSSGNDWRMSCYCLARFRGRAKSAADFIFFVVEMVEVALEVSSAARRQALAGHLLGRDRLAAIGTRILHLSLFPHRRTPFFFSVDTLHRESCGVINFSRAESPLWGVVAVGVSHIENLAQSLYELDEPLKGQPRSKLAGPACTNLGLRAVGEILTRIRCQSWRASHLSHGVMPSTCWFSDQAGLRLLDGADCFKLLGIAL